MSLRHHSRLYRIVTYLVSPVVIIDLALIALTGFGRLDVFLTSLIILADLSTVIVRLQIKRLLVPPITTSRTLGVAKLIAQSALVVVSLLSPLFSSTIPVFCLSAIATVICLLSGAETYILALDARDSSWLRELNGAIGAPNWISLARMALALIIPVINVTRPFGDLSHPVAFVTLLLTAMTDVLDGFIARRYKLVSKLGKKLDPLCDKCIFYPVLIGLLIASDNTFDALRPDASFISVLAAVGVALIVVRDLGFSLWFFIEGRKDSQGLAANVWDKARAVALVVLIAALSLSLFVESPVLTIISLIAITVGAILSAITIGAALKKIQPKN